MATTTDNKQQEMVPRRIKRELPVKLTEAELAQVAKDIGRLNKERQNMEATAKVSSQQWKDRISGFDARIANLATKADDGQEARPVECEEQYDYRRGEVRVIRLDTNETLEVRPMTSDERQPNLPAPGMETPKKAGRKDKAPTPADKAHADATKPADEDAPPGAEITDPQKVVDAADGSKTEE